MMKYIWIIVFVIALTTWWAVENPTTARSVVQSVKDTVVNLINTVTD